MFKRQGVTATDLFHSVAAMKKHIKGCDLNYVGFCGDSDIEDEDETPKKKKPKKAKK